MIPAYLQNLPDQIDQYYGTLTPSVVDGEVVSWTISGDPGVTEFAKRLFPGSRTVGAGRARFPNTKRIIENLNWMMLRYPLHIERRDLWEKSRQSAIEYANHIVQFNHRIEKIEQPNGFLLPLKDFQKEGASYLVSAERSLLADDMGLGKTAESLAAVQMLSAYPLIIVALPYLLSNWSAEIEKFLGISEGMGEVHIIKGLRPYPLPAASIYLIHYGLLRGWKDELPKYRFKAAIFDEIQDLRHFNSQKYSAASLLSASVQYCFGLSGTPVYNFGGEIWSVLNAIEYHCMGDYDSFTTEWCTGYRSDVISKPELLNHYLLKEGLMLRRTKDEVLSELPAKQRIVQTIDFDKGTYGDLIEPIIDQAKTIDFLKSNFEKGRAQNQVVEGSRKAIGIAKAPFVCAFTRFLLEGGKKVLMYAYHHDVFDIYLRELKEFHPVEISGRKSSKEKALAVKDFMDGKTDVCIISLRAAAGLNLQRANCVVFGELDWSPAIHTQGEDRAHRIGQTESLLCYYLVTDIGADAAIQQFLGLKVEQFKGIMGDRVETEEEREKAEKAASTAMSELVNKFKTGKAFD